MITVYFTTVPNNQIAKIEVGIDNTIPTGPGINPAGRKAIIEQRRMSNPPRIRIVPKIKEILPMVIRSSKISIPLPYINGITYCHSRLLRFFHFLNRERILIPPKCCNNGIIRQGKIVEIISPFKDGDYL